jgi:hypothetical protein
VACAHCSPTFADDWRLELDRAHPWAAERRAGFHGLRDGVPYAKVNPGAKMPTVTISHECIELVINPYCVAMVETPHLGILQLEPCDPCSSDSYAIGDVMVSNFVGPRWFWPHLPPERLPFDPAGVAGRYDRMGLCPEPFFLRGGWIDRFIDGRWYRDRAADEIMELLD